MNGNIEVKRNTQIRIIKFLLDHGNASRQEIAAGTGLSMPTTLQVINRLIEIGLICETGEYGSTGGRRAKILSLQEGRYCAVGVEITTNHILLVLLDMTKKILDVRRLRFPYENTQSYYTRLGVLIEEFLEDNRGSERPLPVLTGVGFSLPGTIRQDTGILLQSLQLNVSNVSLQRFLNCVPYPGRCGNNAMNAAYAEVPNKETNILYLSLNDMVGGGAYLDGKSYRCGPAASTLFGHMIIEPKGKQCYCGKHGCLNAYCSALVLTQNGSITLAQFFDDLENGDAQKAEIWDNYMDYLAVAVSNLRLIFGCDIIIGGAVSQFLKNYTLRFKEKIIGHNLFEDDGSYIRFGQYSREAAAVGIAQEVIENYLLEGSLGEDRS